MFIEYILKDIVYNKFCSIFTYNSYYKVYFYRLTYFFLNNSKYK